MKDRKEYMRKYYEKNKEKYKEQRKEKILCECGCVVRRDSIARHKKTDKHEKLMQNKEIKSNHNNE